MKKKPRRQPTAKRSSVNGTRAKPGPKPRTVVLTRRELTRLERFQACDDRITAAYAKTIMDTAEYWWAMWEIWRDDLWDEKFDTREQWIGSLCSEPRGPSRTQLSQVMSVMERLLVNGLTESETRFAIGTHKTAIIHDIDRLFVRQGKNRWEISPQVRQTMEERGLTFAEVVMNLSALGAGEARAAVADLEGKRRVYPFDADWIEGVFRVTLVETGGNLPDLRWDIHYQFESPSPELVAFLNARFGAAG